MQIDLTRDELATLNEEAEAAARRLHRRLPIPAPEIDDLRQDLLLDLIHRLPGYDSQRGTLGAFANIVLRNRSSRIAAQIHRKRREQGGGLLSLDAPVAGSSEPLGSVISEVDALAAWHGQDPHPAQQALLRHDLARALSDLPEEDRRLCAALGKSTAADLIRHHGISRSSLYRQLARLRLELEMRGLGSRWDTSQAA